MCVGVCGCVGVYECPYVREGECANDVCRSV